MIHGALSQAMTGWQAAELESQQFPGMIHVSLSTYSHVGLWSERRGVQSASGIAFEEGQAGGLAGPGKLPCQALDHATGYLAAFATMLAVQRRAQEGGSWQVRVSLAQTGHWLQTTVRSDQISAVRPAELMTAMPVYFDKPAVPVGTHAAQW